MEELRDIEAVIRMERGFSRLIALPVPVITVHIPVRPAGIKICADVIWDVSDHKLRLRDGVRLEVLEVISD